MIRWLLSVMERQGIQSWEMAEMIGMTAENFLDRVHGRAVFTVPEMERMCRVLGVAWHLYHHPEMAMDVNDWRRRHGTQ